MDLMSMTFDELNNACLDIGEKSFRARQIYEWFHVKLVSDYDEMTNLSKGLRNKLKSEYPIHRIKEVQRFVSEIDGTMKFLFELYDGNIIESVMMRYKHGNSVCISSQVGCRMGCKFCASTLDGLIRNLEPSEMLLQVYEIQKAIGERVSNIVVMGSGEPFDNFDNLIRFINLVSDDNGINISQRNITVSTCGLVEKIREFSDLNLQVTLAISIHAPIDSYRQSLMPIAFKYTVNEIIDACKYYLEHNNRRITFEYSLVKGANDSEELAVKLSHLLKGMLCHVNLIPVNPIKERDFKQSDTSSIMNFKNVLEKNNINVTIRREMGRDIAAACGQLRRDYKRGGTP